MAEVEQLDCTNPNRLLALDDDESMLALVGRMGEQVGYDVTCVAAAARFFYMYR